MTALFRGEFDLAQLVAEIWDANHEGAQRWVRLADDHILVLCLKRLRALDERRKRNLKARRKAKKRSRQKRKEV